ncbi:MAG: hypothetical protein A2007_02560 [Verrucomicrobia bacterium GWC2_42_7]|nr:MAG: hypothetical protein A2007_02560 [Verrucomicrobia bacterium GWC2_42_7]
MNTVFCFGATSYPSHNKNRKSFIMRLLKVFLGKVQKTSVLFLQRFFGKTHLGDQKQFFPKNLIPYLSV